MPTVTPWLCKVITFYEKEKCKKYKMTLLVENVFLMAYRCLFLKPGETIMWFYLTTSDIFMLKVCSLVRKIMLESLFCAVRRKQHL